MTDTVITDTATKTRAKAGSSAALLKKRYAAERRFKAYGLSAIVLAVLFLVMLIGSIVIQGAPAFFTSYVTVPVYFDPERIDAADPGDANYGAIARNSFKALFPDVSGRTEERQLTGLLSNGAGITLREMVMADPSLIGTTQDVEFKMSDDADVLMKGGVDRSLPESDRIINDSQLAWADTLEADGRTRVGFDWEFWTTGDSREPEQAGILGAIVGSALTLTVTLLLSFPVGVLAATYLQEFAPRNRLVDAIEVNINNLAAVPSIVFGLLGLAVFLNLFGLPRSAPLVGGMVLALMTLPTIIIATRSALAAVPPSIREAALGVGASELQVVTHHVLPLAMPGILTGTIIGMAQALGETAPLLMIGMIAFIVDVPSGFESPATVLPVQIYLWADSPERAFVAKTSAAIMVLLGFLILMNAIAVLLRRRFERRW